MSGMGIKGFTLIEVLIITAIIGVLTTIAVLNFGGIIDSYKVRGAASQLYSEMQMARLRAIKEGKEVKVRFTAADAFYAVTTVGGRIKSVNLSNEYSGLKMCNAVNVEFNPNGTTNIGGPGATISKGSKSQRVYISSSGTGNIRITSDSLCP